MSTQMKPKERRAQILAEAVRQAAAVGYQNIERQKIADALNVSPALVSARLGTMPELKDEVLKVVCAGARATPDPKTCYSAEALAVIAQGLVAKERRMLRLPESVRKLALQSLHS